MPNYQYTLLQPDGKQIKKVATFDSERDLRTALQKNGSIVVDIQDKGAMYAEVDLSKKPGSKELGVFCTQIHSILNAGVPIIEAMKMVKDTTKNTKLKKATDAVIADVNTGMSVSDSMKKHEDIFPNVMIQMVKAGESSGRLTYVFERLGTQFEKEFALKNNIKKALAYPKMILFVVLIAVVVVCAVVVPMFVGIFEEMGTELPWSTKLFIGLSELFTSKWYIMAIIVVTGFTSFKLFSNSEKGERILARLKLKLPLIGDMILKTESANFARIFSTLLSAGKEYTESLDITKDTVGNIFFKEAITRVNDKLKQGKGFADSMAEEDIFPELLVSMCKIGENTGRMSEMLENAAVYYEEETETATMRVTAAIQPMIIVFLGIFVGLLVYSIYSPMFSMYSGIE